MNRHAGQAARGSDIRIMPVLIRPDSHDGGTPSTQKPQQPQPSLTNGASITNGTAAVRLPLPTLFYGNGSSEPTPNVQSICQSTLLTANMQSPDDSEMAGKHKETPTEVQEEDAVDYLSVRGVFGWTTIDGISIPYLVRKDQKFLSVRIVERKILIRYPNHFPDELARKGPLISYFVTDAEAKLLNEINTVHCSFEYGEQPFTTKDLMVILGEFEEFYNLVKMTYPKECSASTSSVRDVRLLQMPRTFGWMQINNTVVPYVVRSSGKFVPLSVIVHAANLLTPIMVEGLTVYPTEEEISNLNVMCEKEGFRFNSFGRSTNLVHISEVVKRNHVRIIELPLEKPMEHAQYVESMQQAEAVKGTPPPPAPANAMNPLSLSYQHGPPNFNPFTPYNSYLPPMMGMQQPPAYPRVFRPPLPTFAHNPIRESLPTSSMPSISSSGARLNLVSTQTGPIFCAPPLSSGNNNSTLHMSTSQANCVQNSSRLGVSPGLDASQRLGLVNGPLPSLPTRFYSPATTGTCMFSDPTQTVCTTPSSAFILSGGMSQCLPPPGFRRPNCQTVSSPNYVRPSSTTGNTQPSQYFTPAQTMTALSRLSRDALMPGAGHIPGNIVMNSFPPALDVQGSPLNGRPSMCLPQQVPQPRPTQTWTSGPSLPSKPEPNLSLASVVPVMLSHVNQSNISDGHSYNSNADKAVFVDNEHPDHLVNCINIILVHGKKISCMQRCGEFRNGSFCLVEAVLKLYFPNCRLSEFVSALRNVLRINLWKCSQPETDAFIRYYKLPVSKLNDDSMINLNDLIHYFPQISYMFLHAMPKEVITGTSLEGRTWEIARSSGVKRLASPSQPIHIVLNSNNSREIISLDSESSPSGQPKRRYEEDRKQIEQLKPQQLRDAVGSGHQSRPSSGSVDASKSDPQVIIID